MSSVFDFNCIQFFNFREYFHVFDDFRVAFIQIYIYYYTNAYVFMLFFKSEYFQNCMDFSLAVLNS
jgi:hypothetical protein